MRDNSTWEGRKAQMAHVEMRQSSLSKGHSGDIHPTPTDGIKILMLAISMKQARWVRVLSWGTVLPKLCLLSSNNGHWEYISMFTIHRFVDFFFCYLFVFPNVLLPVRDWYIRGIGAMSHRCNFISEKNQWGHCSVSMIRIGFAGISNIFPPGLFRKVLLGACALGSRLLFFKS